MLLIEMKKRNLTDVIKRTLFEQNCLISSKRILNVYILLSVAFLFQIFFHSQYTIERIKYLIIASGCRQHIVSYFWISNYVFANVLPVWAPVLTNEAKLKTFLHCILTRSKQYMMHSKCFLTKQSWWLSVRNLENLD